MTRRSVLSLTGAALVAVSAAMPYALAEGPSFDVETVAVSAAADRGAERTTTFGGEWHTYVHPSIDLTEIEVEDRPVDRLSPAPVSIEAPQTASAAH